MTDIQPGSEWRWKKTGQKVEVVYADNECVTARYEDMPNYVRYGAESRFNFLEQYEPIPALPDVRVGDVRQWKHSSNKFTVIALCKSDASIKYADGGLDTVTLSYAESCELISRNGIEVSDAVVDAFCKGFDPFGTLNRNTIKKALVSAFEKHYSEVSND